MTICCRPCCASSACSSRVDCSTWGVGNGSVAQVLTQQGWDVTGVDPSAEGIAMANARYPHLKLYLGSAYDDLAAKYGRFPVVTSLEVVEHVYAPRQYAATLFDLLEPGGVAFVSTPYHGYWKNLALALSGEMDAYFTAPLDHGHIKGRSAQPAARTDRCVARCSLPRLTHCYVSVAALRAPCAPSARDGRADLPLKFYHAARIRPGPTSGPLPAT